MKTHDMLILAMAIQLSHQYGRDRFMLVTNDARMSDICQKASKIPKSTASKLNLPTIANDLGYGWSADTFPRVLNLGKASKRELVNLFQQWPPVKRRRCTTKVKKPF